MSAVEFSSLSKRDSVASISSAFDFRQFTSATANTGNEFLGLSLPLDLSTLFQVSKENRYLLFGSPPPSDKGNHDQLNQMTCGKRSVAL